MAAFLGTLAVALGAVAAFAAALAWSGLVPVARKLINSVTGGVTAMLDSTLNDDAKEKAVRQAGLTLLLGAWQVAWRFVLAFAAAAAPIFAADAAGLVPQADSFAMLLRVDFIVAVSILAIAVTWLWGRRTPAAGEKISSSDTYGPGEKLIHSLAFSGPGALHSMARIDDRLASRVIAEVSETPPIFITSLARGGTTALLNALHELPEIATHRYSDMPFIAAPILWSKLAGRRRSVVERERAHGDGMKISLESPEAFDEIFWMLHWPEKYQARSIELWDATDLKPEARDFLLRHFRKIIHLRRPDAVQGKGAPVRYLSKNNANIARLALLPGMFPGCDVIIALRDPAAHAASLHRQHRNFAAMHDGDDFGLRYMRDIGHLEFGSLHRPIGFDLEMLAPYTPDQPDYWLAYWLSCFERLGAHAGAVSVVTQADLRAEPQRTMVALSEKLRLTSGLTRDFGAHFRQSPDSQPDELFDPALLGRARAVYAELARHAIR